MLLLPVVFLASGFHFFFSLFSSDCFFFILLFTNHPTVHFHSLTQHLCTGLLGGLGWFLSNECCLFSAIAKTQSWKWKIESRKPGLDSGGVETHQFCQCHKIGNLPALCMFYVLHRKKAMCMMIFFFSLSFSLILNSQIIESNKKNIK